MKIIDKKELTTTKFPIEHKCEHCRSILEIELDDLFPEYGPCNEYAADIFAVCQSCKKFTEVTNEEIDPHTRKWIRHNVSKAGKDFDRFIDKMFGKIFGKKLKE